MFAHISIGVSDVDRSRRFYDAVLEPLRYKCLRRAQSLVGYGYGRDSIAFWVVSAERPVPADEKSGLHFCFAAPSADAVDAFHAAALRAAVTTTVHQVYGQSMAPITTPPSLLIRTDSESKHITVQVNGNAASS